VEISKENNIRHRVGSEFSLVLSFAFNIKNDSIESVLRIADLYRANYTSNISREGKSVGEKPIFRTGFLFSSRTLDNYICITRVQEPMRVNSILDNISR